MEYLATSKGRGSLTYQHSTHLTNSHNTASHWLQLIEKKKYSKSWEARAPWLSACTLQDQWIAGIQAIRNQLGSAKERTLQSTNKTATLQGMPDGKYVTFTYSSRFEPQHSAIETLTLTKEKPGT